MRTSSSAGITVAVMTILLAMTACAPIPEPGVSEAGIVDGTLETAFPEVMLLYNRSGGMCTATLISPHVLLTARHCVTRGSGSVAPASSITFYVGSSESSITREYRARTVFIIPGSSGEIGDGDAEDVALVEITTAAEETPREIALTSPSTLVGRDITAVGFGQTPAGRAGTKYRASGSVEGYQRGLIFVDPTVCSGDSGGPAIGADGLIYGVASFIFSPDGATEPVCGTAPGAYNEIFRHVSWIQGVLEQVGDICLPDEGGEVCDGIDNDCNDMVDEGCMPLGSACTDSATCVGGLCATTIIGSVCTQECDPARPSLGCAEGFYCAGQGCAGHCVPGTIGAMPIGASCAANTDCASLYCDDPGDGNRRCLAPCRSGEGRCLAGEICLPQGDACGGCVAQEIVAGVLHGLGEPCALDADCRSGMCRESAGIFECVDACGESSSCPLGFECRTGPAPSTESVCVRARGGSIGAPCTDNPDCDMGVCARSGDRRWCTAACAGEASCPDGFTCTMVATGVSVCAPELALVGEACTTSPECASGLCGTVGSTGTCVQACGPDLSCGTGFECRRTADGAGAVCARPVTEGGGCAIAHGAGGHDAASMLTALLALALVLRRRRARHVS